MKNKVTYLFGAGASCKALPMVNEIPDRIKNLIELLERDEYKLDETAGFDDLHLTRHQSKREIQLKMIESLKWMLEKSANHASVDTFAKKLYIRDSTELDRLKIALSVFFIFEQARNKPDNRYDAFFASLIDDIRVFPDHIRILSWNYDYQFELAFSEYLGIDEISTNQNYLQVSSKWGDNKQRDGFEMFKLNGTTAFAGRNGMRRYQYINNLKGQPGIEFVEMVTRNFAFVSYVSGYYSTLSFAWEKEEKDKCIIEKAMLNTKDTAVLVVIGYSFPFFNREIDRKIIGSMKNLSKVYIQSPDAHNVAERFQAMRDDLHGIEILNKLDVGQFLLPNEL